MKIHEDLVWDKRTGDLIGYVDLGMQNWMLPLWKKHEFTSHVLVFLVQSIGNPMKFNLVNYCGKLWVFCR